MVPTRYIFCKHKIFSPCIVLWWIKNKKNSKHFKENVEHLGKKSVVPYSTNRCNLRTAACKCSPSEID